MDTRKKPVYQLDKICRICLQIKANMQALFENQLPNIFQVVSGLEPSINDGLPQQLCIQCVHAISRANSVREMIVNSTETLKQYIAEKQAAKSVEMYIAEKQTSKNTEIYFDQGPVEIISDQILPVLYDPEGQPVERPNKQEPAKDEAAAQEGLTPKEENEDDVYNQAVALQAATSLTTPGRYICNLCHKEFKHPRWLKVHMRAHTNWIRANFKRPPTCTVCEKVFKGPGMLRMHMKSHETKQVKTPTCTVCMETFRSKGLLYKHRQTHYENKTHKCTVCEKVFNGAYALRSHMARHRGEKTHSCACGKSFYNSTELKVHNRVHTGEKPLTCSICSKMFRRHSTLCQHMKKHNGVRNHVCSSCGKAFFDMSKLKAHLRTHTGERPYECNVCGKSFTQRSALSYHAWTHSTERPRKKKTKRVNPPRAEPSNQSCLKNTTENGSITCIACGEQFTTRVQLLQHSRAHRIQDQTTVFNCSTCQTAVTGYNSLIKHLLIHKPANQTANTAKDVVDDDTPVMIVQQETRETNENNMAVIEQNKMVEDEEGSSDEMRKYRCGYCVKSFSLLQSLKKHIVTHTQIPMAEMQLSGNLHVLAAGNGQGPSLQLLGHPGHLTLQGQQAYPVISSVQSLQLQQQQQQQVQVSHVNPQLVQTIQLHPQSQPIQIHAVGMHQVQAQQQLHVASSTCQSVLPNILQLQPTGMTVSGLPGQQDLSGNNLGHRIILQQQNGHPTTVYLHH